MTVFNPLFRFLMRPSVVSTTKNELVIGFKPRRGTKRLIILGHILTGRIKFRVRLR